MESGPLDQEPRTVAANEVRDVVLGGLLFRIILSSGQHLSYN